MADATKTRMGVCNVSFDGSDLGYTKGFVKIKYNMDTVQKEVDQEDAPIDEIVKAQDIEVTVPIAEYDLNVFQGLLPGATYTLDSTKKKLVLSGAAGTSLKDMAKKLILTPTGGDANDALTLYHAAPKPQINYAYDKDNMRVWEVTFVALKGTNGWVTMGDETASQPVLITSCTPSALAAAGGEAVIIKGYGFTGATAVTFDGTAATDYTVIDDLTVIAVTPAETGTVDLQVTSPSGSDTFSVTFS